MMRIFKKKDSVPQLIKIEELAEKRQDMEINPKPSRDFSQPVHQTPTPKDKRRPFFGRVGGVFLSLFHSGKKKKYVANDLQEINVFPPATTEDNVTVSEKKAEATSGTDSAHPQTAEALEFPPSAETVAAPIDGLQLSISAETVTIPESGIEVTTTTDNELDQRSEIQSTNAKDIVETVPTHIDGTESTTTTERDSSSDSTYVSAGELEFTRAAETLAELKDRIESNLPTEAVPIPDTVIMIPSFKNESDSEDTTQFTDSSDIVETESTSTDGTESTTTKERDPSSDSIYVSAGELEFTRAVETVTELKDRIESNIPTETVSIPDTMIEIPSSTNKSDTENTTQSTDSSDIVESTPTDEIETIINIKYVVKLMDGMDICICTESAFVGWQLKNFDWKISTVPETETTSSSSGSRIIIPDRTRASEESDQPAQQTSTPADTGRSFFSKIWAYFSKKEEREENEVRGGKNKVREGENEERGGEKEERGGEKEERGGETEDTSSKEVSQIQSDVPAPLTPESFKYHRVLGEGAFGKVLLASHPAVDQLLAIKIAIKPCLSLDRLLVERQAMEATEGSRFFPQLFATFQTKEFFCYVMEYVNGETLNHFILTRNNLDNDTIRFIAAELLCAIQFLHARGIAHRDLHTENILIDSTGHVKIIDFGETKISKIAPCTDNQPSSDVSQETLKRFCKDYAKLRVAIYQMISKYVGDNTHIKDFAEFIQKVSADSTPAFIALRHHPFFTGINWDELEAGKISPPFVMKTGPAINRASVKDAENLVDCFYEEFEYPQLDILDNVQGFDFVSDRWRDMQQRR